VKARVQRKPTWGTCAGLILLAESANRTKRGGQELIGGLDVRVNRNHFGRQTESFEVDLDIPFLADSAGPSAQLSRPFRTIFIRAPVVEKILPHVDGVQKTEESLQSTVVAPSKDIGEDVVKALFTGEVEVMARLPNASKYRSGDVTAILDHEDDIVAVRQGNVFGTSFHPELTSDHRIHSWWLGQVLDMLDRRKKPISE
jgi:pyridoxal 5'-phosphate synthase pdxT subunit